MRLVSVVNNHPINVSIRKPVFFSPRHVLTNTLIVECDDRGGHHRHGEHDGQTTGGHEAVRAQVGQSHQVRHPHAT